MTLPLEKFSESSRGATFQNEAIREFGRGLGEGLKAGAATTLPVR